MRTRHVLTISLGLNLMLGAFFLFRQSHQVVTQEIAAPVRVVHETVVEVRTNLPTTNSIQITAQGPSAWSKLESEDYATYIANLRNVGCPERTIQHIILEDIEKLFREKERQEPEEVRSWLTGPERDARQRERRNRKLALFQEKSETIKTLLGRELDGEARKVWVTQDEPAWFLSFLTDDQAEQAMSIGLRHGQEMEQLFSGGTIFHEDDIIKAEGIYRQMIGEFQKVGGPAELEEAMLRATLGINFGLIGNRGPLSLSPEELRSLVLLQLREEDPFKKIMRLTQGKMDSDIRVHSPEFLNNVKQLLGPQRFTDYLCAQDEQLNNLRTMLSESGNSVEPMSRIFEVQQLTLQEAERIRGDRNLTRAEKRAELRALQQTTREAIKGLGTSPAIEAYVQGGVSWLQGLEKL